VTFLAGGGAVREFAKTERFAERMGRLNGKHQVEFRKAGDIGQQNRGVRHKIESTSCGTQKDIQRIL
jgi:hypothetical protein